MRLILFLIAGLFLLMLACGDGGTGSTALPTESGISPTPTSSPTQPISGLERQIIDGLIELFPESCLNEEGAFAAAESLLVGASSQEVLDRATNIIQVCKEADIWLGN